MPDDGNAPAHAPRLPTDYDARKAIPLDAVLDYFPDALVAVAGADVSGAEQNADELLQAFMNRGNGEASARLTRIALIMLQREIEAERLIAPKCFEAQGLGALFGRCADALVAVAGVIAAGQRQHGTHGWDRAKSKDEAGTLIRHFVDRGTVDTDGVRHSAKMAWRALALLQKEIEAAEGLPISRGSYDSANGVVQTEVKEWCLDEPISRGCDLAGFIAPGEAYLPKVGERVRVVAVAPFDKNPAANVGDLVCVTHRPEYIVPDGTSAGMPARQSTPWIYLPGDGGTWCRVVPA